VLAWDLSHNCLGTGSLLRHDGHEFSPETESRLLDSAGKRLPWVAPLIQLRGDWPAICEVLGQRTWSHKVSPCLFCTIPKNVLKSSSSLDNISLSSCSHPLYTHEDYVRDVARARIDVDIHTEADRSVIVQHLEYNKDGLGRVLTADLVRFRLSAGDRLIPSSSCPDTESFGSLRCPVRVSFLRCGKESRIVNLSPLFDIPGFSISRYAIDLMHGWHLGPLQSLVGEIFWLMIRTNVWTHTTRWLSQPLRDKISIVSLKSELWAYYRDRRQRDPTFARSGTEVPLWAACGLFRLPPNVHVVLSSPPCRSLVRFADPTPALSNTLPVTCYVPCV
jgi:hypothetical protein